MAIITLRQVKGTPLTIAEMDSNFSNLNVGSTLAEQATSANTASAIVRRDASGNFTAGTITANLTGAVTGNASTATALQTARTISVSGDVTGSVSFNGTANADIVATIQPNSVALGTDTTGNYVATVAGTADQVLVSGAAGEGTATVLSLPQSIATTSSPTFANVSATSNPSAPNHLVSRDFYYRQIWKDPVRVAATVNINLAAPGTTIDSVTLAVGESFLAPFQTTASQNGIYVFNGSAVPATRRVDADTSAKVVSGTRVQVMEGASFSDTQWVLTTNNPITLGTTALVFTESLSQETRGIAQLANVNGLIARTGLGSFVARNLAASGTGITITNADGVAGNPTVNSNATAANTASTIVARDASGNFSAGSITAALNGTALNATNVNIISDVSPVDKFITFADLQTGFEDLKTNVNLKFNSGTGLFQIPSILTTGNMTVGGNLIVNGTTTTVNSTTVTIDDPVFTLGGDTPPATDDNKDRGIEFRWHNGTSAKTGFFGFDDSTGFMSFIPDATNTAEVFSGAVGVLDVQRITGSAATLTNPRIISISGDVTGSTSFDGSGNVNISATIQPDSVALGTDTTGNYASSVGVSGNGLTITGAAGEGTAFTVNSNAASTNTGNSIVFRDGSGNFSAGTISANLNGNASTASTLATARTISLTGDVSGSVSFNGGSDVSITAVVADDSHTHDGRYYTEAEADSRFLNTAGDTVSAGALAVTGNSSETISGFAVQRRFLKSIAANSLQKFATFSGNPSISLVVESVTSGNGAASQYLFYGTFNIFGANGAYRRLMPLTNINGFGEGADTGTNNPWHVYIRQESENSFGVYVGVPTGSVAKDIRLFASELNGGTAFTDNAAEAPVALSTVTISGVEYSVKQLSARDNLFVGTNRVFHDGYRPRADTLTTPRTISLSGDVTGSTSFDGSSNVTIAATIQPDSVALGTDTTGNYVATASVSGVGLTGSATGEGSTFTVTSNATSANTANTIVSRDASGNFSAGNITANLNNTVTGTNSTEIVRGNMADNDSFRILIGGTATNAGFVEFATADDATEPLFFRQYTGPFTTLARTATILGAAGETSFPVSVTAPTFIGSLTGNASTATTLQTARTISLSGDVTGSVSFNGSANADIVATIAANSVALGTDTTGSYVAVGAVSGNGLSGSANAETATFTVTSNATDVNTANTIVFRNASGNFSAGTITATLSGNATTATTATNQSGGTVSATTISYSGEGTTTSTSAFQVPVGTTAQRPTGANGKLRYNTTSGLYEGYSGADWSPIGASTILDDTTTNATRYLAFTDQTSGVEQTFNVSSTNLTFNPSSGTLSATTFVEPSDARLKTDIEVIPNAMDKVAAISGYTYTMKATGEKKTGLIAQELIDVLPEVVQGNEAEGYAVAYGNVVGLLVEAIKELKAEIEILKAR